MNVKELAKQMFEFNDNEVARVDMIDICRFANVIADAEREACARLCAQEAHDDPLTAWNIAQLIRGRTK